MTLTYHIRTYGCQMNERDSEALGCLFEADGMRCTDDESAADVVVINTCSVRDQAERKVFGKVGLLKKLKRQKPGVIIGVIGCMAQSYGAELLERFPHVDFVVGTDRLHTVPGLLKDLRGGHAAKVDTAMTAELPVHLNRHGAGRVSAFVSAMRGCDQFCSYCIVPFVRGRERSRSVLDVVAEVEAVVSQGAREVVLLGQNITAYGLAEARTAGTYTAEISPFSELLRAVHAVDGLERIRFTSPHPRFMNAAFIAAICELPKVCKAFHIPLQSGSDRILDLMRRGYSIDAYLACISEIRTRVGDVSFSTDVIVGFPSETDADFAATRRAMETAGFDMAYIFKYSPRHGTAAATRLADDVPQAVKEERNQALLADLACRATQANGAYVGRAVQVLVEGPSKRNAARWSGRTDTNRICHFTPVAGLRCGELATVRIVGSTATSLFGEIAAVPV